MRNEGHKDVWLVANFKMLRWHSSGWMQLVLVAFAFTAAYQGPLGYCSHFSEVWGTNHHLQQWQVKHLERPS